MLQHSSNPIAKRLRSFAGRWSTPAMVVTVAIFSSFLAAASVAAADIEVDTLDSTATDDANCSLREAIAAANGDSASDNCVAGTGWDRITFSVSGTITLSSALPHITEDVSIVGPGADGLIIDGNGAVQILVVQNDATLLLDGLSLVGGFANSGGAIWQRSGTALSIVDCVVDGNIATNAGGGILVENESGSPALSSTTFILRSTISNNESQGPGGGGGMRVGISATAVILDSTFSANDAVLVTAGTTSGGAISVFNATATIARSTFSGNSANDQGGALRGSGATLNISHSTIYNNTGGTGGGIYANPSSMVTVQNSIIASNVAVTAPNFSDLAPLTSLGSNFVSDNTGATVDFPGGFPNANGDFVGTGGAQLNADLTILADNGGATETHMPAATSDVIDLGGCFGESADQRGYAGTAGRVDGLGCDIGAVEFGGTDQAPIFSSTFEPAVTHRWSSSSG